MLMQQLPSALVALLPVLVFLAALLWLDSYKLLAPSSVVAVIGVGAVMAAVSYPLNAFLLGRLDIGLPAFSRYVSPLTEELLKGLIVLALVRMHRIGFLVDAAIYGFAVGAGFALAENLYYLHLATEAGMGTWIVRGFGTAIMHGGATALFAVMGLALLERSTRAGVTAFLPGLALAVVLHSAFNHFFLSPLVATVGIVIVLPPLAYAVFEKSDRALGNWLGKGFDADTEMLALINSGRLTDSPLGRYLHTLKDKFKGPVVADLLCYLRLTTELALRAKGVLMMRESGFAVPVDEATREKFAELSYLESSIGRTGLVALHPLLHMSHKDLWQLYMLKQ
jgi:RsiW-degrading membrane proteinase PrsW (M82 family)